MNEKVMFSSNSPEWETPQELFNELNEEYKFTLDPCATTSNYKVKRYFTKREDGLSQDWSKDTVFVNPPYGRDIAKWVKKAYYESIKGATVVLLLPARTDTRWFHNFIYGKGKIKFLKGRIKFLSGGVAANPAPFPSMIVEFKPKIEKSWWRNFFGEVNNGPF